jgi:DNA polymerase-3 subunit delta
MTTKYTTLDYFSLLREIEHDSIKPIYLIYGEEAYLHNMIVDRFKIYFAKIKQSVNYETFSGEDLDFNRLANSLQTLPLGAVRQCIIVKQIEKLRATFSQKLDILLNNLPFGGNNLLILLFSNDKQIPKNISLEKIKQFGAIIALPKLKPFQIRQWIKRKCQEGHKEITEEAIYYLQRITENDLSQINSEIEKLFCFLGDTSTRINKDDVIDVFYGLQAGNIFDFVDALGERKTKDALVLLRKLEESDYHPLSLLAMINRQIRLILQTKLSSGDLKKLEGEINLPPFVIKKLISQSQKYQLCELKKAYSYLLDAEISLKTNSIPSIVILEQLVVNITGYSRGILPLDNP